MDGEMFRPPVNQAMKILDRSFFRKTVPLAVAVVSERQKIHQIKTALSPAVLRHSNLQSVTEFVRPDHSASKAILLKPEIRASDKRTWPPEILRLAEQKEIEVESYNAELDYNFWDYQEIMNSILPESMHDDYPKGFSIVGHVAHLNLRDEFLPFKHLIATVLLDKNENLKTVINKVDDVGSASEFRTFNYEILAGIDDLNVEAAEEGCLFNFDYSKVYWNPRLQVEHRRLVALFKPGEAICDVMAGVGPFAVPAGKKRCWVLANDLNPYSFDCLKHAVHRNKVKDWVEPCNIDGRAFIMDAANRLMASQAMNFLPLPKSSKQAPIQQKPMIRPQTFTHYVLNLPASAITFLPSFIGLYAGREHMFAPRTDRLLPLIHVYCFDVKTADNREAVESIRARIKEQLGVDLIEGDMTQDHQVSVFEVRDVSPCKRMFCASFRLPASVAFQPR